MGGVSFSVSDSVVRTIWENSLDREVRMQSPLLDPSAGLAGTSKNSLIVQRDELTNGGGTLRIKFRYQLEGDGKAGDEQLKGSEEGYMVSTFDITVDTLRHAVATTSPIQDQWVSEDTLEEGRDALADWAAQRLVFGLHAHATGLPITKAAYNLNNTIAALNSDYIIRPNNRAAGALVASDRFDVGLLTKVSRLVKQLAPKIRPAQTPWGPKYCCFISPEQSASLQEDDSQWYSAMQSALQGGMKDSGVFTRALGMWKDIILFEDDFVPPGLNSGETAIQSNTRRAWVGGAGALTLVFGRGWKVAPGYSPNRWQWVRESEDFNHQNAMAAATIVGAKRPRFTRPTESSARENGVIVIETYADLDGLEAADVYRPWTRAGLTIA